MTESDKKSIVVNTSDPNVVSANGSRWWVQGGNPAAIRNQEAEGQRQLAESEVLPSNMQPRREVFERMGITFGETVEGDPLFVHCTLPQGWKKIPTEHDMWSTLVDSEGRTRAYIFYKAAFYDRHAYMSSVRRMNIVAPLGNDELSFAEVRDGQTVIFRTPDYRPEPGETICDAARKAEAEAEAWANTHFPEWANPNAYWDLDQQAIAERINAA